MDPDTLLSESENRSAAAIIAALALDQRDPAKVKFLSATPGAPALVLKQPDVELRSLEEFAETPHRPDIRVALDHARDLHTYVIHQTKDGDRPVIFANRNEQSITAFLDYHHAEAPRWLNHVAHVQYRKSHQFARWQEMNNKQMTQDQFALFIDEMLQDFITPTGAEMMTFATHLETYSDQTFKSSTKLATGETELTFVDSRKGDVSTKVIEEFTIGIPVWQNGELVQITAKLFHRLVDNKDSAGAPTGTKSLRFWFTLRHIERIIDALFAAEVEFLRTAFDGIATIYNGTAPAAPKPRPFSL